MASKSLLTILEQPVRDNAGSSCCQLQKKKNKKIKNYIIYSHQYKKYQPSTHNLKHLKINKCVSQNLAAVEVKHFYNELLKLYYNLSN